MNLDLELIKANKNAEIYKGLATEAHEIFKKFRSKNIHSGWESKEIDELVERLAMFDCVKDN